MAESILRSLGAERFNAFSAGSHPKGAINPFALKTIEAFGCSTEGLRSKSWNTRCAEIGFRLHALRRRGGRDLSRLAGTANDRTLGIEDPAVVEGADIEKVAFAQAFRYLRNRITVFIALPIKSLDSLSLTARLREIGKMEGATRPPMTMRNVRRG
jgi:arsenate reductase (thioredoxin)